MTQGGANAPPPLKYSPAHGVLPTCWLTTDSVQMLIVMLVHRFSCLVEQVASGGERIGGTYHHISTQGSKKNRLLLLLLRAPLSELNIGIYVHPDSVCPVYYIILCVHLILSVLL